MGSNLRKGSCPRPAHLVQLVGENSCPVYELKTAADEEGTEMENSSVGTILADTIQLF